MKKIAIVFALLISFVGTSFAKNPFAHRFFEVRVDVPVEVSNNLVSLKEVMQESVVIDLSEIAERVAFKGAAIKAFAAPTFSLNLDIPRGLILGLSVGVEGDASVGLSKDLFEFLGNGNVGMGDDFVVQTSNTYADIFATATVKGGWNFKKSKIEFEGTAFSTLAHFDASQTSARVFMKDNKVGVQANLEAKGYSNCDLANISDVQGILSSIGDGIGFDVGAKYQRELFKFLTVGAQARIPIVPSRLNTGYNVTYTYDKYLGFDEFVGMGGDDGDDGSSSEVPQYQEGEDDEDLTGLAAILGKPIKLETPYAIHRPLKFGISADFHPFGTLLSTTGYVGVGFRHPFASAINKDNGGRDETQFYFDYSIGGRLSLWNILSFSLSHSYMDEVFKNQFTVELNIRLLEVDAGVSFQSTNFAQSFTGAGVGAFVTLCVGF